ncbi:sulfurtransferase [Oceanirhabdus seepicola]|uniref:thiosulfate sulfurtransferase n=1 Tax=Oceanirhabdus seepicola TaxID=2828781 RepID=A0A9J6P5D1_9CLOT|nr:sulfurtransferase [Oceanirhabdus seepicola]MCM1991919.1 sulfurtransferase [Oceanirhabdus seepicola]
MKKINKIISVALSISIIAGALVGCGSKEADNTGNKVGNQNKIEDKNNKEEKNENVLINEEYKVNAQWLSENINDENIVVIDARAEKAYLKGHIPGAISVPWQSLSKMEGKNSDKGWGTVLDKEELEKKLGELGINNDKTMVAYCDTTASWGDDGRIVWMLQVAGIENAKILDGGVKAWNSLKLDMATDRVSKEAVEFKITNEDKSSTINTEDLAKNLSTYKIIDTRAKVEYEGAQKYGELRGGHITGAINIPFNTLVDEKGMLKSPEEIEKIMRDNGINREDEIVTYCTAGIRSAHMAVVLKMIGYENVKNYDESIYTWAADENLDMEK